MSSASLNQEKELICIRCHVLCERASNRLQCVSCKGYSHIEGCISGKYTELEITKIKKKDTPIFYMCPECQTKMQNIRASQAPNATQNYIDEIQRLKQDKTRDQMQLVQQDEVILDLKRNIEVLKNSAATPSGSAGNKRPRISSQEEMQISNSQESITYASLTGILIKQSEVFGKTLESALINAFNTNGENLNNILGRSLTTFAEQLEKKQDSVLEKISKNQAEILDEIKGLANKIQAQPIAAAKSPTPNTSSLQPVKRIKQSFAQVLASSVTPANTIRNISIKDDKKCAELTKLICTEKIETEAPMVSIKNKGDCNLTFTCASAKDAETVERALLTKYKESIEIKKVIERRPEVKIVKLVANERTPDDILAEIKEKNPFLHGKNVELVDSYTIVTNNGNYLNLVVTCDLDVHADFLRKGTVIFGFAEYRVHERFNLMQCQRCQRFGHIMRVCKSPLACCYCAEEHETRNCTVDADQPYKCANCTRANDTGLTYKVNHCARDDRCVCKIERINALKSMHLNESKNE